MFTVIFPWEQYLVLCLNEHLHSWALRVLFGMADYHDGPFWVVAYAATREDLTNWQRRTC